MKALVIIDMQNDFCPGGSYPIPNGDKVVKPLNKMLAFARKNKWVIFASRDWHSEELFEGIEQKKHCVKNTNGAQYHPNLDIDDDVVIISKGEYTLDKSHYSAFNGDTVSLNKELEKNNVTEVYIGGLALDYCVKNTALDAVKNGYKVFVLTNCSKPLKDKKPSIPKASFISSEDVLEK